MTRGRPLRADFLTFPGRGAGAARLATSFGWAVSPRDGTDALALVRAADERLRAQKLIRSRLTDGEVVPMPTGNEFGLRSIG